MNVVVVFEQDHLGFDGEDPIGDFCRWVEEYEQRDNLGGSIETTLREAAARFGGSNVTHYRY